MGGDGEESRKLLLSVVVLFSLFHLAADGPSHFSISSGRSLSECACVCHRVHEHRMAIMAHGRQDVDMSAIACHQSLSSVQAVVVFSGMGQGDTNWDVARAELNSRNFDMQGCFLDALLYGLPQSRKRFYVCGVRSSCIGEMR